MMTDDERLEKSFDLILESTGRNPESYVTLTKLLVKNKHPLGSFLTYYLERKKVLWIKRYPSLVQEVFGLNIHDLDQLTFNCYGFVNSILPKNRFSFPIYSTVRNNYLVYYFVRW